MSSVLTKSNPAGTEAPPIDARLLKLSSAETEFLHATVSEDDEVVKQRILDASNEAYEKHPYTCIRLFHHVQLMMAQHPLYSEVLAAGKAGNTNLIDVGCCIGSDVRKLVWDGYPGSNVLGTDLLQDYLDLGHKFYKDAETCPIRFISADVLQLPVSFEKPTSSPIPISEVTDLVQLRGSVTHVYTGAVFHLFDEATQYEFALRLATLSTREKGAVIFGRHQGLTEAGMIPDPRTGKSNRFGHSTASWPLLWKKVFTEIEGAEFAETRIKTSVELAQDGGFGGGNIPLWKKITMLVWSVQII